ncbi:glycoside hydrolase family 3 C-terminal domain-containing protein [Novosphingobium kaempferiae]|uniref:glycoside hydrolase family 3 C-terminal domain-containing protein n=1 Tax=Novosphingobium kaempferiae TaxID=2896849 RepID=UPI001E2DB69E|nr:glycoside hydrolase family 3 C-terminal domain-containing protein [Novosphingobium kaempferiae]
MKHRIGLLLCAATSVLPAVARAEEPSTASLQRRAAEMVSAMSLEEKAGQLKGEAPAIPRLGIPAYDWWSEGLHGVARAGEATVFPQAVAMAATFDAPLIGQTGDVISTEFRAKYRETLGTDGSSKRYRGLTVWSPNINIFRDPRWGRGQETFGEDPYLTSRMGVSFVRGLQGDDPVFYKTAAVAKHFAVHSGPESNRHHEDVHPSPYDLEDTYLPAFRATVTEARPAGIMCAYNAIDGVPACGSPLLAQKLRGDWGFAGHVVTDCAAMVDFFNPEAHAYSRDPADAVASAVRAGTDLICVEFGRDKSSDPAIIVDAVRRNLLPEPMLDRAIERTLTDRLRLGLPGETTPYSTISPALNDTKEHAELNRKVARESLVLLKNDGLLPLAKAPRSIAVIGPNADSVDALVGNYNGTPSHPVTILEGLRQRFPEARIEYVEGTGHVGPPLKSVPGAVLCVDAACNAKGVTVEEFAGPETTGKAVSRSTRADVGFGWGRPARAQRRSAMRWSGWIVPEATSEYHFRMNLDDGYRILVDGTEIADAWDPGDPPSIHNDGVTLTAGKAHRIVVEARQEGDRGDQSLLWTDMREQEGAALAAARNADLVVFAAGLNARLEGEEMRVNAPGFAGGDRTSLDLPAPQETLLEQLHATGKPVVLVLMNGSAMSVNWAQANLPAIVEAWYPGGVGGRAVADMIAGDFSPAGRLPVTFYSSADQLPAFGDYAMKGRTYRYFGGKPLYPFGYGLSYTSFAYAPPVAAKSVVAGKPLEVSTRITNSGKRASDEVAQLYVRHVGAGTGGTPAPRHALQGFSRIHLEPGESREVRFTLEARALSSVDDKGARSVLPGEVEIWVGGGQPDTGAPGGWIRTKITGKTMPLPK